jgi:hypothetical protein
MKIYVLLLLTSLSATTAYGSGYESDGAPSPMQKAQANFNHKTCVIIADPEASIASKSTAFDLLIANIRQEYLLDTKIQHALIKEAYKLKRALQ